jgi:hypothetical protein
MAGDGGSGHPKGRTIALLIGVTVFIVVLSAMSTFGRF